MSMKGDDQGKLELLVFGYACKLFRDDEKAHLIDSGSHLIPWMGDETLKIDRYDARGALNDLSAHEPKSDYNYELSDEDDAIEQLCDKERYRSLYINEEEEAFYQEEILKRAQQREQGTEYREVSYNYDVPNYPGDDVVQDDFTASKPFVPAPELKIPSDMKIPETVKHNAILERTALFLAQQGSQMEILMKVKQQGNKNFDFLSHTDELHEYYKHLKALIKSGSYVPQEQYFDDDGELTCKDEDHYLHPSLVTKLSNTNTPSPPSVQDDNKPPPPANTSPPDYLQKIMQKMVKYVIKNGNRFETAIMKRGDIRFSFLNPKNPYHSFYKEELNKKQLALAEAKLQKSPPPVEDPKVEISKMEEIVDENKSVKRKPLPVSFSIKKPKENEGLEVPSALPLEESDEEDESNSASSPKQQKVEPEVELAVNPLEKRIKKSTEVVRKHKQKKKDVHLQNERKLKVAQFIKDLKKKGT